MKLVKRSFVLLFVFVMLLTVPPAEVLGYTGQVITRPPLETKSVVYFPVLLAEAAPEELRHWTDDDVITLSRMVWGEGRGVSENEQKLIVWTVLNRVDDGRFGASIRAVVIARGQFVGYSPHFPVTDEIRDVVIAVLEAWDRGEEAKVYPPFAQVSNYLYFNGDGRHNWFRARYR